MVIMTMFPVDMGQVPGPEMTLLERWWMPIVSQVPPQVEAP